MYREVAVHCFQAPGNSSTAAQTHEQNKELKQPVVNTELNSDLSFMLFLSTYSFNTPSTSSFQQAVVEFLRSENVTSTALWSVSNLLPNPSLSKQKWTLSCLPTSIHFIFIVF